MTKRGRPRKIPDHLPKSLPVPDNAPKDIFEPSHCQLAANLANLGLPDVRIAEVFGISHDTIEKWQRDFPEFAVAIKSGRVPADGDVARSLYERALGFKFKTQEPIKLKETHYDNNGRKISEKERVEVIEVEKAVPADTVACIFWLKNRQRSLWRDRIEHTGADGGAIKTEQTIKVEEMGDDEREMLRAVLAGQPQTSETLQ